MEKQNKNDSFLKNIFADEHFLCVGNTIQPFYDIGLWKISIKLFLFVLGTHKDSMDRTIRRLSTTTTN